MFRDILFFSALGLFLLLMALLVRFVIEREKAGLAHIKNFYNQSQPKNNALSVSLFIGSFIIGVIAVVFVVREEYETAKILGISCGALYGTLFIYEGIRAIRNPNRGKRPKLDVDDEIKQHYSTIVQNRWKRPKEADIPPPREVVLKVPLDVTEGDALYKLVQVALLVGGVIVLSSSRIGEDVTFVLFVLLAVVLGICAWWVLRPAKQEQGIEHDILENGIAVPAVIAGTLLESSKNHSYYSIFIYYVYNDQDFVRQYLLSTEEYRSLENRAMDGNPTGLVLSAFILATSPGQFVLRDFSYLKIVGAKKAGQGTPIQ